MNEMLLLRLVHVVGGAFWVGAMFFFVLFLEPTLRNAGAEGGRMMMRIGTSKYPPVIALVAVLTILTGARLYMKAGAGNPGFMSTGMGMTFGVGGAAAITAFLVAFTMTRPAGGKMAAIAKEIEAGGGRPSEAQMAAIAVIRARLTWSARTVAGLLLVAIVCMAVARYVG